MDPNVITAEADLARALEVARQFAAQLRERFGDRIEAIRLFGSAARGDWSTDSDVDILVLLRDMTPSDADDVSRMGYNLGLRDAGVLLRPLALDRSRFEFLRQRERRIALDIDREGLDL